MPSTPVSAPLWKQEVNRRLAEHRNRRPMPVPVESRLAASKQANSRAAQVAARVAARYAQAPSYTDGQHPESPKTTKNLSFALEQHEVMPKLEPAHSTPESASKPIPAAVAATPPESVWPVTLFDSLSEAEVPAAHSEGNLIEFPRQNWTPAPEAAITQEASTELSIFEVLPEALSGTVLEAPSAEKAPTSISALLYEPAPMIFEAEPFHSAPMEAGPLDSVAVVEAVAVAAAPAIDPFEAAAAPATWTPLPTVTRWQAPRTLPEQEFLLAPDPEPAAPVLTPAGMNRRLLAGFVDCCLIGLAFVATVTITFRHMEELPDLKTMEHTSLVVLLLIAALYMVAFSALSMATPGMRYAGLVLSNFKNRHPRREQRLGRMGALLLSLAPLGLGVIWPLFDEDGLSWHDRLSQTYLRKR